MINETPEWAIKAARIIVGNMVTSISLVLGGNAMTFSEEVILNNAKLIYMEYLAEHPELKEVEAAHE